VLDGWFEAPTGRPYITGRLVFPRLGIDEHVSFCIDTGADMTSLMPGDGRSLGVEYSRLRGRQQTIGVGGRADNYTERALLLFTEPRRGIHVYRLGLTIAALSPGILTLPSLLGRDVINRWRIDYHPTKGRLRCHVVSADVVVPLRGPR